MFKEEDYIHIETEDETQFIAKKPDEDGFIINVSYTKSQEKHEEAMEAIKKFFVRETL
ncbi:hypothetical protein [Bacillus seohaeanensis]|uniref:DUF1292 domain-containing protein n=1 Tax=Bacillus seohaeanensis TaxID=284580 RepID=A0ABW5RLS6_9BACI